MNFFEQIPKNFIRKSFRWFFNLDMKKLMISKLSTKAWSLITTLFASLLILNFSQCTFSKKNKTLSSSDSIDAKIDLGHHLFFETRLSGNNTKSCSSCHDPQFAFSDSYRTSSGIYGDATLRNSPSLLNVKDRLSLTWSDRSIVELEDQMVKPLFADSPAEMGAKPFERDILRRIVSDKDYKKKIQKAFPQLELKFFSFKEIKQCIAIYMRQLNSYQSAFDRYKFYRDSSAMSSEAIKGMKLFFSERIACSNCHGGTNLDHPEMGDHFANIGIYNCGDGNYPSSDQGEFNHSRDSIDRGSFKVPSLRNVAITSPYYHDGSEASLLEVIKQYERGGRLVSFGDCQGEGAENPLRNSGRLEKFQLTNEERSQLLAFLHSLTDTGYLHKPLFTHP